MSSNISPQQACPKEFRVWVGMRQRCRDPNAKSYPIYGARGIAVDPRWNSFAAFLADMGPRPGKNYTVERMDNDGPYSPENCRWATRKEQQRNMRSNRILELNGERYCLAEWAERLGVSTNALSVRLKRMSVEEALTKPWRPDSRRAKSGIS